MPRFVFSILIIIFITLPASVFAQEPQALQMTEMSQVQQISESISQVTGTAISPLLVTTALGIYRNIKASSAEERSRLPWYNKPWFLSICGILTILSFIISIPSIVANLPPQVSSFVGIVNKYIGLALTIPIIFDLITPVSSLLADNVYAALIANDTYMYASVIPAAFLAELPAFLWLIITSVLMLFVFIATWLLNCVFDFLIFLCPFGWLETAIKSARAAYFGMLLILTAINPVLTLILTLPVLIIAVIAFGWSIRRVVMGFVYIRDFIFKKKETIIDDKGILAFSESGFKGPAKRMGRLSEENGKWLFTYRKAFLFKKTITKEKNESLIRKGFLYSEVFDNKKILCSLPPRYQKNAEQVQAYLSIDTLEDSKLKKGIKAVIAWIKNLFSRTPKMAVEVC